MTIPGDPTSGQFVPLFSYWGKSKALTMIAEIPTANESAIHQFAKVSSCVPVGASGRRGSSSFAGKSPPWGTAFDVSMMLGDLLPPKQTTDIH